MRLLEEKRDLLKQLIAVESKATGAVGNTAGGYSDSRSVYSGSSGVSSLTYATFASNSNTHRTPSVNARKVHVPKLNL